MFQRIRDFLNDMRYINVRFTYLLIYLPVLTFLTENSSSVVREELVIRAIPEGPVLWLASRPPRKTLCENWANLEYTFLGRFYESAFRSISYPPSLHTTQ